MQHPDDEILTQFALDDPLALDAATLVHISDCDRCTHEIEQIQRVVDAGLAAGGRPDLRTLVKAPPVVWERVLAAVGGRAADAADADDTLAGEPRREAPPQPEPAVLDRPAPDDEPIWLFDQPGEVAVDPYDGGVVTFEQPTDRRTLWLIAGAAVVGLVLGAGVAWVVADNDSTKPVVSGDVATSTLTGINGHVTSGEISFASRDGSAPEITVNLDRLDRDKGFVEAWLLDPDTNGMVALGVIEGAQGTFTVPPSLNLSKYNTVDVSREPFDGDPAHSGDSLARGSVPQG